MRQYKPYCPLNGRYGMINGVCCAFPVKDCKFCGQSGLTNFNQYYPNCFICFTCTRVIKKKYNESKVNL